MVQCGKCYKTKENCTCGLKFEAKEKLFGVCTVASWSGEFEVIIDHNYAAQLFKVGADDLAEPRELVDFINDLGWEFFVGRKMFSALLNMKQKKQATPIPAAMVGMKIFRKKLQKLWPST